MLVEETHRAAARGPQIWPLSVETYHRLGEMGLIPEKTELLYGQIFEKLPKSPYHAYLLQCLLERLRALVPRGFLVRTEQPITFAQSEPEPDLSIVRGEIANYRHAHPTTAELVIEVCVTSHDYDRSKLRAFAEAEVKECWLVLGPERQIEVHRQPQGGQYTERRLYGPGGTVSCVALPGFVVELDRLFAV